MPLSPEIQDFIIGLGNSWEPSVNTACEQFFESCHASLAQAPDSSIRCEKNVKYGAHERHRLDIYSPSGLTEQSTLPVVVYFHGGGFRIGDNAITPHLHANIARFFAANGMVGVLGTYRLLPEARFPDGMEDVASALAWLQANAHLYGGDRRAIFLLGHSAGGAHLAMALFSGRLQQRAQHGTGPRGVVLLSAALAYDHTQELRRVSMEEYYSTLDWAEIEARSGLEMFQRWSRGSDMVEFPELFIALAEHDFGECVRGNLKFLEAYAMERKRLPRFEVLPGHNHVSYSFSIGLPGDEVGPKVVEWVRQCLSLSKRK